MPQFVALMDTANAAFAYGARLEIARILRSLAETLELGGEANGFLLRDANGNVVGGAGLLGGESEKDVRTLIRDTTKLALVPEDLPDLVREILSSAEWNGRRQGYDLRVDLPAGTLSKLRAVLKIL